MKTIHMRLRKATVVTGSTDKVTLEIDRPSSFPSAYPNEPLNLSFEAEPGTGAEYVKLNFGIDAEVINRSR
jgi:hypothetical protein